MLDRYRKQTILPQIGELGQQKLTNSKVLVIGAGGLGCPVLLYLAGAGIGNIGIMDGDSVAESNLHRQILYDVDDIGSSKVLKAAQKLQKLNPNIAICIFNEYLNIENALEIIRQYDVIVDCTDNFDTRYLINDACVKLDKSFVYGALHQFEGQVSVFNYQNGPTYRCLFPQPSDENLIPNCAEIGVLGTLAGIIGSIQANEVIKIITGTGEILAGKLLIYNSLNNTFEKITCIRNLALVKIDKLANSTKITNTIKTITWNEILSKKSAGIEILIIDVRNTDEYLLKNIGALSIPLPEIKKNLQHIPRHILVAIHCQTGVRSAKAIALLQVEYNYDNLYNLIVDFE